MSSRPPLCISRRLNLCAVALGVCALLALPKGAAAQAAAAEPSRAAATQRYALEAAPLGQTLDAIAKLGDRRVVFEESMTKSLQAAPVVGLMSARQAVEQALKGTGLSVSEDTAGALQVSAKTLEHVIVVAKRDQAETSFKADRSDTATRSGTDLLDVPQAVTIITGKVLETQQALSVRDALANVSGVAFTQTPQGSPGFSIRGFDATSSTVNGVNDNSASLTNVFTVERIEVLKGPQAILAGADALGGGVNVVTKKPQADPIRSLLVQYGSHADVTVAGDLAGAVTDDKRLTYRLIAADSQARNSAAGFDGRKDEALMPQLRWKDASTDLIVGLSYGKQHAAPPEYTFARRDGLIMPSPGLLQGNREDGFDTSEKRASYQLEQKLTPQITLVSRLQRSIYDLELHLYSPRGLAYDRGAAPDTPNGKVTYGPFESTRTYWNTSGDHYLRIAGDTGPVSHKLSVGVNHTSESFHQVDMTGSAVRPMVYPPDLSFVFPDLAAQASILNLVADTHTEQAGLFAQDLMNWGDWNLLINLRRTRYDITSRANRVQSGFIDDSPKTRIWATTPGVGLVYMLTPETSLYASYAKGFSPQSGTRCGGGLLPPITTANKELGAKFDLLGSKLSLTTAAFELAESNTIAFDAINDCDDLRPSQVTRGVEADLQGQLAPGWNATLNYTFNTIKDVGDSTALYPGLAKHKISLWTTYDLQGEPWRGFGVGLGLSASSHTDGTYIVANRFTIPGQTQVDASLFYQRAKWSVIFGVKNIADRRLYGVSRTSTYVPVLEGRNYMLTVKRDFN